MNENTFAFPHEITHLQKPLTAGMTLRDYFAAKAMQGLMGMERAEQFVDEGGLEMCDEEGETGTLFVHTNFLAKEAYMIADMMLKAREV
ncbi:MAG: hypothetical protein EBT26_08215 [Microbacteriaceae bacterium]|nr:hypothetical protein [Microbacteriaceae bacterium]NBS62002.1 hypothetical protein [Microbacteriaceae bacterium]